MFQGTSTTMTRQLVKRRPPLAATCTYACYQYLHHSHLYCPTAHGAHSPISTAGADRPGAHAVQLAAPAALNRPATHAAHPPPSPLACRPAGHRPQPVLPFSRRERVPHAQRAQYSDPGWDANFPTPHAPHLTLACSPDVPALNQPGAHTAHARDAVAFAYRPPPHAAQYVCAGDGWLYPTAHAAHRLLSTATFERPAAHATHSYASLGAPLPLLLPLPLLFVPSASASLFPSPFPAPNLPAGHDSHAACPHCRAILPLAHTVHMPPAARPPRWSGG